MFGEVREEMADRRLPGGPDKSTIGRGAAANEMIKVTVGGNGLIRDVQIDPRAMRLDPETMAAQMRDAVLAAQKDLLRQFKANKQQKDADSRLHQLDKKLTEVHEAYVHQMNACGQLLDDILRRMEG
ncbi:MAG: YbaB/EbfC family nucleoid-associated protein [Actinomadura sp.]